MTENLLIEFFFSTTCCVCFKRKIGLFDDKRKGDSMKRKWEERVEPEKDDLEPEPKKMTMDDDIQKNG